MRGRTYLLDTVALQGYIASQQDFTSWMKCKNIKADRIWTCSVVIGEVKAGHLITNSTDAAVRRAYEKKLRGTVGTRCWNIEQSTGTAYARIMDLLLQAHPREIKSNGHPKLTLSKHLEKCGVGRNDIWIAAVALDRNAILVTRDKMRSIRDSVQDLNFDSW